MNDIKEVLRLKYHNQLSSRKIRDITGISKSTVNEYIALFEQSGLELQVALSLRQEQLEQKLFPKAPTLHPIASKPLPDFAYIHQELKQKGVTRELLWQQYREEHPDGYGITQFKEHYNRYARTLNPSMRQIHYAGDKLFVDFSGLTLSYVDSHTGEVKKAQIFVAVLGASGYTFAHACESQNTEDFITCHNHAFRFYGGVPNSVVPDNLKAAVITHTKAKLVLNVSYADMARHYGVAIEPARPYHPKDKSKVEAGVKGIQRWILARLRNHTFFSVDEINEAFSPLLDLYNQKIIKRLGKSREQMFAEIDKEALHPLPANTYTYREHKRRKVACNYHIDLDGYEYSVPHAHLGKEVDVWFSKTKVSIAYRGETLAVHPRLRGRERFSTHLEHMPKAHEYIYQQWNPGRILNWAQSIGPSTVSLMQTLMKERGHPAQGFKTCIAILNFSKTYGNEALEMASHKALEINLRRVASMESMLKHKTYHPSKEESANNQLYNAHDNLRGADYYQGGKA